MKHLKSYESTEYKYQIGEYVICKDYALDKFTDEEDTINFLSTHIGQIIRYSNDQDQELSRYKYIVIYENVPKNIIHNFNRYGRNNNIIRYSRNNNEKIGRAFSDEEIIAHSPIKEDLEIRFQQNKYNL